MNYPTVGAVVLIPPADCHWGGKAFIEKIEQKISAGELVLFITTEQCSFHSYNWDFLIDQQDRLAIHYGDRWAHAERPGKLCEYSFNDLKAEIKRREEF